MPISLYRTRKEDRSHRESSNKIVLSIRALNAVHHYGEAEQRTALRGEIEAEARQGPGEARAVQERRARRLERRRQPLPRADPSAAALEELGQRPGEQPVELPPEDRGLGSDGGPGDLDKDTNE